MGRVDATLLLSGINNEKTGIMAAVDFFIAAFLREDTIFVPSLIIVPIKLFTTLLSDGIVLGTYA